MLAEPQLESNLERRTLATTSRDVAGNPTSTGISCRQNNPDQKSYHQEPRSEPDRPFHNLEMQPGQNHGKAPEGSGLRKQIGMSVDPGILCSSYPLIVGF